jgi:CheY-like chemotaxis protein
LAQVLDNLLNNACRYTEAGGRIAVTLDFRGATARVRVQDSGIGLGGAELERIFDLFTQVERTGRTRSGLGIGLALSRQIAELHGGTLQAESEGHDKGSTFTLTLPLSESPEVADGSGADAMAMRASELPRRVLVVDDNADAADGLAMVLRMRGIETRTAYDGMEATVVARQMQPDAVLLDLGMPQLDGLGLARWIRQQSWERRPWLVAITGWGQAADRARSTEAGIDLHLTKPVDADALLGELARLAGGVERSP